MKNNSLQFLLLSIFLASCGGGGGSSLVLTVQQFSSFSVNEDDTFQTVISSSTNKPANITYTISKPSANANVTISNSGALFYSPQPNYYGADTFSITVIATPEGQTGSYESQTLNVNANVISVNDPPTITINDDLSTYNESTLIFDDNLSISPIKPKNLDNLNLDDVNWIASHPIAGTEFSGPEAGFAELFENRWCILSADKSISKDEKAYAYLPESVEAFPEGKEFENILIKLDYKNVKSSLVSGGIATIYTGIK